MARVFFVNMNRQNHWYGIWTKALKRFRLTIVPVLLRVGKPVVFARRRLWPHKVSLCRVEAVESGGQPFAVLCSGSRASKSYFLRVAFPETSRVTELGKFNLREVFRRNFAADKDCQLIAVETKQPHFDWLKTDGCFFIPTWVSGGVRLPVTKESLNNTSTKNDLRKIKRHELAYSISQDAVQFEDFYNNLHLPFVRKTYGDEAVFDSLAEKRAQCEQFDLLLVHRKSRPDYAVAGVLLIYEPAGVRFWSVGVRQDGEDHVRTGVLAALYHFSFEHLAKNNSWMSLGGSRPFLHDGVLSHKRKLSHSLTTGFWTGMALKVEALTPGVKNFLKKNPFIFFSEGRLQAAVFVDEKLSAEKIQRLHKDYLYPGLARLVIHTFCDDEDFSTASLPLPLNECVVIRPASELLTPRKV